MLFQILFTLALELLTVVISCIFLVWTFNTGTVRQMWARILALICLAAATVLLVFSLVQSFNTNLPQKKPPAVDKKIHMQVMPGEPRGGYLKNN